MDGAAGYLVIGVRYFVRVRSFTLLYLMILISK